MVILNMLKMMAIFISMVFIYCIKYWYLKNYQLIIYNPTFILLIYLILFISIGI